MNVRPIFGSGKAASNVGFWVLAQVAVYKPQPQPQPQPCASRRDLEFIQCGNLANIVGGKVSRSGEFLPPIHLIDHRIQLLTSAA